jgi:hypothetical protein
VILACKQAAFIQNPDLPGDGSGPDIVTVGHNPYTPNFGTTCVNFVLPSHYRRRFVDEYMYERLFLAPKPFASGILRNLSKNFMMQGIVASRQKAREVELARLQQVLIERDLTKEEEEYEQKLLQEKVRDKNLMDSFKTIPYGAQHINRMLNGNELLFDFVNSIPKDLIAVLKKKQETEAAAPPSTVSGKDGVDLGDIESEFCTSSFFSFSIVTVFFSCSAKEGSHHGQRIRCILRSHRRQQS